MIPHVGIAGQIMPGADKFFLDCLSAEAERRHIQVEFLIDERPVPDLHTRLTMGSNEHAKLLAIKLNALRKRGANVGVLASILAHSRLERIREILGIDFEMIDLVEHAAKSALQVANNYVGVLAHETVIESELFHQHLGSALLRSRYHYLIEQSVNAGIHQIRNRGLGCEEACSNANALFFLALKQMAKEGAKVVVLGSVAIPLVLTPEQISEIGIPVIDPYQVAARVIVDRCEEIKRESDPPTAVATGTE